MVFSQGMPSLQTHNKGNPKRVPSNTIHMTLTEPKYSGKETSQEGDAVSCGSIVLRLR